MGGKSGQTIGWHYLIAKLLGVSKGPVDALLEIRGGEKTAWQGEQTESGTISINAPNLWGGEKGEGGIVGDVDVMMGEATQTPSAYMAATFSASQPARRGLFGLLFKGGRYGAMSPYAPQKLPSAKVRRIYQGWDDDTCWYPLKAAIPCGAGAGDPVLAAVLFEDLALQGDLYIGPPSDPAHTYTLTGFATTDLLRLSVPGGLTYEAWSRWPTDSGDGDGLSWGNGVWVTNDADVTSSYLDTYPSKTYYRATAAAAAAMAAAEPYGEFTGSTTYRLHFNDWVINLNRGGLSLRVEKYTVAGTDLLAMNPAHILYDATTSTDGLSEPIGLINSESLTAAADQLYAEGLGLCTVYDPNAMPDIRDFMQLIVDIIGAGYSQSRVDGEYYLDLIRDDYVLDDLLVIGEDDVISVSCQASIPTEAVNQVTVTWFDPQLKLERTTPPVKALGLIQASGKVISTNYKYQPIPSEALALRVAKRQLLALSTPLRRFELVTNRIALNLRKGLAFRLDKPSEQINDVVCRVVEIKHGTHENGRIALTVVEDIFAMPATASITVGPAPTDTSGSDTVADQAAAQLAFEAPYFLLARQLSAADFSAVTDSAGYLATVATPPASGGLNYALNTAADGEDYVDRGVGYWCPSALVVESATADPAVVNFTLSGGYALDEVLLGTAALWGNEIVRIDAIDAIALTVTLGRACADTVPQTHTAGERIWFFDSDSANDGREYIEGELVHAKLLTRTSADELALADAVALDVTIAARQALPYAPGQFAVNGNALPTSETGALAVTWAHRSRILEADQLLESAAAGVGPEPGVQYVVTLKNNVGAVLHTSDPISGTSYTFTYTYTGTATLELKAIRGALESWQQHSRTFTYNGASTSIPPVTPGPSTALDPLDGTEIVAIEQDGIDKEATAQAIANLAHHFAVATGTADALAANFVPDIALVDGLEVSVRALLVNTGAATFAPDAGTARAIKKLGGVALAGGDIAGPGHELKLRYVLASTTWELLNPAASATSFPAVMARVSTGF